jgi:hypothetical protein
MAWFPVKVQPVKVALAAKPLSTAPPMPAPPPAPPMAWLPEKLVAITVRLLPTK